MIPELKKFLTPEAIVAMVSKLPDLQTPIMDLLFTDRRNHPSTIVGKDDLGLPSGNLPMVRRDSQSYPMESNFKSFEFFEPQPVKPSIFIPNATLNDFVHLAGEDQNTFIQNKIDALRRSCRATAESLCIQSLTGKITAPLFHAGQEMGTYTVDYGTIGNATAQVAKKFDAAGVKVSDLVKAIPAVLEVLKGQGVDGNNTILAIGYDVFAVLCDIVGAQSNNALIAAATDGISVGGGFKFTLLNQTYKNLKTGAAVPAVPLKHMLIIDKDAGHKLLYAALDSMGAGLQAMPFFVTEDVKLDPPGVKLIGESKPFPVVNVRGIVKAQVLT